jgi:hypothetical protein
MTGHVLRPPRVVAIGSLRREDRTLLDGLASALVTVSASGAFSSLSTTVLLSVEETLDALAKAQGIAYRPPGG